MALLIVTTLVDENDAGATEAAPLGTGLSLREALALADGNGSADSDTITFAPALHGGTLFLSSGQQLAIATDGITIDGDIDGDGAADITIDADSDAISDDAASRVFFIDDGAGSTISATLNGLVIQDGYVAGLNDGGGIFVGQGDALTLTNAAVYGNTATFHGGGIYALGGALTLTNVIVAGNTAPGEGGGIFSVNTALTLTDVAVYGNEAFNGGGILATGGAVAVTDTTVAGNSAYIGGGLWLGNGAAIALTNVTVAGNTADAEAGGINAYQAAITLTNVTVSGNSAVLRGGGIQAVESALTLTNATVTGNSAGISGGGIFGFSNTSDDITLANSIVAGNAAAAAGDDLAGGGAIAPDLVFTGHNIIGSTPAVLPIDTTNGSYIQIDGSSQAELKDVFAHVVLVDPDGPGGNDPFFAGLLADNAGPVQTVALNPAIGNPALDSGDATRLDEVTVGLDLNGDGTIAGTIATDARGFARPAGAGVDLGALEQQAGEFFEVTTLEDEIDSFDPAVLLADPTDLSLREALFLAQQDPTSVDDITFAADLIGGTTALVDNGEIVLVHGELYVFGNVNINGDVFNDGTGDITVRAALANPSAVFHFYHGISRLNGVTVTGGNALYGAGVSVGAYYGACGCSSSIYADLTITNSVIHGNYAEYGGGISVDTGSSLRLVDSTVTDNDADVGGGIAVRQDGTLTVVNSVISTNSAHSLTVTYGVGGGIASRGAVTVIDSTLSGNSAYYGGGIYNNGTLTVVNTTLAGNTAQVGGGLYNYSDPCGCHPATATLISSTVSDNVAEFGNGGGIANYFAALTLINTTLHSNVASEYGGGIANDDGVLTVINSTLSGNYAALAGGGIYNYFYAAGAFTLTNSIVAGNLSINDGSDIYTNVAGTYTGGNIVGDTLFDGNTPQPGLPIALTEIFESVVPLNLGGTIPVFDAGELANNGGPVQTIAILLNGAAQDKGDNAFLPDDIADLDGDNDDTDDLPFDARGIGFDRVINADVDLGAFEIQDGPPSGNTAGGSIQYVEDQAPTALDPALTVSDPGGFLTGAEIAITGNFAAGQDLLGFVNQSGITGSFNAATGVLTLSGLATDAQYQAALRTVTFANTSQNPSNAARTVNFQVDDGGGLVDIGNVGVNVIPVLDPPGDLNGDHTTDIVWRDDAGTVALWEMDGVNVLANNGIATRPTTWDIVDTNGDYDGDGNADILWRDDTGGVVLWTMDGPNILAETVVAGPIADYWQVADTGDFTGDGRADILWRDDAGRVVLWEMNGADIVDNSLVSDVLPSWQLHDSADFSGDGRNDILWRDDDGNIRIWLMDGATRTSDRIVASLPDYWRFAATGDFNGDASYDILWRDDTGTVVMWEMDGTAIVNNTALGTLREYWQIADTGDYDGDLNHDILWRDTAGAIVLWQMDGPTILDSSGVNTIDPRWHIEG